MLCTRWLMKAGCYRGSFSFSSSPSCFWTDCCLNNVGTQSPGLSSRPFIDNRNNNNKFTTLFYKMMTALPSLYCHQISSVFYIPLPFPFLNSDNGNGLRWFDGRIKREIKVHTCPYYLWLHHYHPLTSTHNVRWGYCETFNITLLTLPWLQRRCGFSCTLTPLSVCTVN